jgi:hypothetical protein
MAVGRLVAADPAVVFGDVAVHVEHPWWRRPQYSVVLVNNGL